MPTTRLWNTSLERPAHEVERLHSLLSLPEQSRAARFLHERDRRRFVVARGTLRTLLGEHIDLAPERVPIGVQAGGKPALADASLSDRVFFNVSHCGDLALFAIADREIGIDIERLNQTSDLGRVAAHFFAPDESAAFEQLTGFERTRFFYGTWVRKEAYLKATGRGLSIDPSRVKVQAGEITVEEATGALRSETCYEVHDVAGIDEHVAAVVIRKL